MRQNTWVTKSWGGLSDLQVKIKYLKMKQCYSIHLCNHKALVPAFMSGHVIAGHCGVICLYGEKFHSRCCGGNSCCMLLRISKGTRFFVNWKFVRNPYCGQGWGMKSYSPSSTSSTCTASWLPASHHCLLQLMNTHEHMIIPCLQLTQAFTTGGNLLF